MCAPRATRHTSIRYSSCCTHASTCWRVCGNKQISALSPSHTYYWPPLGIFALHSIFLYSDTPPPSDWPRLFSSQNISLINNPTISSRLFFLLTLPMKMEQTERSETLTQNSDAEESPKRKNTTDSILQCLLCDNTSHKYHYNKIVVVNKEYKWVNYCTFSPGVTIHCGFVFCSPLARL
jgi:hypothetical protein